MEKSLALGVLVNAGGAYIDPGDVFEGVPETPEHRRNGQDSETKSVSAPVPPQVSGLDEDTIRRNLHLRCRSHE